MFEKTRRLWPWFGLLLFAAQCTTSQIKEKRFCHYVSLKDACGIDGDTLVSRLQAEVTASPRRLGNESTSSSGCESSDRLPRLAFQPRHDVPEYTLEFPIDWAMDPFSDRNWRFKLHAWSMLDETSATLELNAGFAIASDWYRYHFEQDKRTDFSWYDMGAGQRATRIGQLLAHGLLSSCGKPQIIRELVTLAYAHVQRLRNDDYISNHNHGVDQIHGLHTICSLAPFIRGCEGSEAYAVKHLERIFNNIVAESGATKEHAAQYHHFASELLSHLLDSSHYEAAAFDALRERQARVNQAIPFFTLPDGRTPPIGDSDLATIRKLGPDRTTVDCVRTDPCARLADYRDAGFGIVRTSVDTPIEQSLYFSMNGSFNSLSHKHADHLSVIWFARGHLILSDAGKYAYERGAKRLFVRSTRAHTTVEIDDDDFPLSDGLAFGSALNQVEARPWGYAFEGRIEPPSASAPFRRWVGVSERGWVAIDDRVFGGQHHTQWFQLGPAVKAVSLGSAPALTLSDGARVSILEVSGSCSLTTVKGKHEPRLEGWRSVDYKRFQPSLTLKRRCVTNGTPTSIIFAFDPKTASEASRVLTARLQAAPEASAQE